MNESESDVKFSNETENSTCVNCNLGSTIGKARYVKVFRIILALSLPIGILHLAGCGHNHTPPHAEQQH